LAIIGQVGRCRVAAAVRSAAEDEARSAEQSLPGSHLSISYEQRATAILSFSHPLVRDFCPLGGHSNRPWPSPAGNRWHEDWRPNDLPQSPRPQYSIAQSKSAAGTWSNARSASSCPEEASRHHLMPNRIPALNSALRFCASRSWQIGRHGGIRQLFGFTTSPRILRTLGAMASRPFRTPRLVGNRVCDILK
jgi:hypothetical protein